MQSLTSRENDAYEFIKQFRIANKFSPSLREIGDGLGVSYPRAKQLVDLLQKKGRAIYTPGKNRTIKELAEIDD